MDDKEAIRKAMLDIPMRYTTNLYAGPRNGKFEVKMVVRVYVCRKGTAIEMLDEYEADSEGDAQKWLKNNYLGILRLGTDHD